MSPTRWLLALLILVGGCTSTSEPSSTTTAEPTTTEVVTTTTLSVRQAIDLGRHPDDTVYCHDEFYRLKPIARDLSLDSFPSRPNELADWAAAYPDEFTSVCAFASVRFRSSDVADRVVDVYGDEAFEVMDRELDDIEMVWCTEHVEDVSSAAGILDIGPIQLLPGQLKFGRRVVDQIDEGHARVMWAMLNPDDFVRSCQAAFGAR